MVRPIRIEGEVAFVPLTQGYEAVIDAADVPLVEGYNWYADIQRRVDGSIRSIYAARNSPRPSRQIIRVHAVILEAPLGLYVDHRDGDGLNCRRSNLRVATEAQNTFNQRTRCDNTSGAKGVSWDAPRDRWKVQIQVDKKNRFVGRYRTKAAASQAYAEASAKYHGEFGRLA